jgi:hypothetical protein
VFSLGVATGAVCFLTGLYAYSTIVASARRTFLSEKQGKNG